MRKITILFLMFMGMQLAMAGPVKTIHVVPDNAKIYVNGSEVGTGMYTIKFSGRDEFMILKFEAVGYQPKTVRLMKEDPRKTISYRLTQDEAAMNSVGAGEGMDIANKFFSVNCKQGMSEDVVWRRLMNIAINNFENVEVRDKAAGWIKTGWTFEEFGNQIVRTRLEIRLQTLEEGELAYRVKVYSEIADLEECGRNEQCFQKYDRVLKKYGQVISELQTTLGSNL